MTNKIDATTTQNKEIIWNIDTITKNIDTITNRIDSTTIGNKKIGKNVKKITSEIKKISNAINNELLDKGDFQLKLDKHKTYFIKSGENLIPFDDQRLRVGIDPDEFSSRKLPELNLRLEGDNLLISYKLYDQKGKLIFEIDKNNWSLNPNGIYSRNYNSHAVEILDDFGNVRFQISLKKNIITVKGVFNVYSGTVVINDSESNFIKWDDKDINNKIRSYSGSIERIFNHTGKAYLGRLKLLSMEEERLMSRMKSFEKEYKKLSNQELFDNGIDIINQLREMSYFNATQKGQALDRMKQKYSINIEASTRVLFNELKNRSPKNEFESIIVNEDFHFIGHFPTFTKSIIKMELLLKTFQNTRLNDGLYVLEKNELNEKLKNLVKELSSLETRNFEEEVITEYKNKKIETYYKRKTFYEFEAKARYRNEFEKKISIDLLLAIKLFFKYNPEFQFTIHPFNANNFIGQSNIKKAIDQIEVMIKEL